MGVCGGGALLKCVIIELHVSRYDITLWLVECMAWHSIDMYLWLIGHV